MDEYGALDCILRRLRNSIPRTLLHWLYFKRHVLEKDDVRTLFQTRSEVLTRKEFRLALLESKADPRCFGPRFCRLSSRLSRERNIRELISIAYRYYLALLSSQSPVEVRRSSSIGGLGIFLKQSINISCEELFLEHIIFGLALELSDEEYEELHRCGYPSLIAGYRKQYLLAGPLALINHSCSAPACFSVPQRKG